LRREEGDHRAIEVTMEGDTIEARRIAAEQGRHVG
jgi:hypothetical protein